MLTMDEDVKRQVGRRFAHLRKKAGLTQAQAVESLGLSDETLSRIERGTQWTDLGTLAKLARLYRVELGDLLAFSGADQESPKRAAIQDVVDLLRPQTLHDIEMARDMLAIWFTADGRTKRPRSK